MKISEFNQRRIVELHDEGNSVRQIAKILTLSPSTVSIYLRKAGADTNRSATAEATAARLAIINAKKMVLAEQAMETAFIMHERITDEYDMPFTVEDGVEWVTLSEPLLKEQLDGARAVESLIKTVDTLTAKIADPGIHNAQNVLKNLVSGLVGLVNSDAPNEDSGLSPEDRDHEYDISTDPKEHPTINDDDDYCDEDCNDPTHIHDDEGEEEEA